MHREDDLIQAPDRRTLMLGLGAAAALVGTEAQAASAAQIDASSSAALAQLYSESGKARELGRKARGILIFPSLIKAGFIVGGQGGEGALRIRGRTVGYYSLAAASFGFQAGAQKTSLAMFFITRSALDYLQQSQGWALGAGPSLTVVDQGASVSLNTTQLTQDVYAMVFGRKGLMGGIDVHGSKITHIHPS
jgi:lipid-binding SYLF domain-containing protein